MLRTKAKSSTEGSVRWAGTQGLPRTLTETTAEYKLALQDVDPVIVPFGVNTEPAGPAEPAAAPLTVVPPA